MGIEIKHEERLGRSVVPDLDHPLCSAREEDAGHVSVPRNVVDGRVVGGISLQISANENGQKN